MLWSKMLNMQTALTGDNVGKYRVGFLVAFERKMYRFEFEGYTNGNDASTTWIGWREAKLAEWKDAPPGFPLPVSEGGTGPQS